MTQALQTQIQALRKIITQGASSPTMLPQIAVERRPSSGLSQEVTGTSVRVVVSPRRPAVDDVVANQPLGRVATRIYIELHAVAVSNLEYRNQSFSASQTVFHQSNELLYKHLGIPKATFYRGVRTLVKLGLIARAAHYCDWFGLTRASGTVYAVALKAGHHAVLRREDKAHKWRNLKDDIEKGHTAWSLIQSIPENTQGVTLEHLKAWAVAPGRVSNPLSDCPKADAGTLRDLIYTLPDVENQKGKQKDELITRLAQALAAGFLDQSNFKFWCSLLYRAAETGHLTTIKHALTRLITDLAEWPGLQRPGELLVARLKVAGIWNELQV